MCTEGYPTQKEEKEVKEELTSEKTADAEPTSETPTEGDSSEIPKQTVAATSYTPVDPPAGFPDTHP